MLKKYLLPVYIFLLACNALTSATPAPVRTPLPTLTPTAVFYKWDAARVVRAFREAGLENENPHTLVAEEYGALPLLATQAVGFSLPSVCSACKGMVLSFDERSALEATTSYYSKAANPNDPNLSAWVFEKDNILLQLSGQLPKKVALQYGAVLVGLR